MNREELKALGLTDEQIEEVMKAHGKSVNDYKEKAEQVDTLSSQIDNYKSQITERDTQLEELKKVDGEGLQARIDELQAANETTKTEYEEKLQQQAFEHKLHNTLKDSGVRNVKAVKALLDTESIKLDGDMLLGLDDQLKELQKNESYLFATNDDRSNKPIFTTGNHNKGSGVLTKEQIMQEKDNMKRQQMIRENSHLFK